MTNAPIPITLQEKSSVHPIFRDAYFSTNLECDLHNKLKRLTTMYPFFDVVFTGHSFCATLASIGAMRYATQQPMIRVSCCVYGSPRVGGPDFRWLVHSLPNLKVINSFYIFDSIH